MALGFRKPMFYRSLLIHLLRGGWNIIFTLNWTIWLGNLNIVSIEKNIIIIPLAVRGWGGGGGWGGLVEPPLLSFEWPEVNYLATPHINLWHVDLWSIVSKSQWNILQFSYNNYTSQDIPHTLCGRSSLIPSFQINIELLDFKTSLSLWH